MTTELHDWSHLELPPPEQWAAAVADQTIKDTWDKFWAGGHTVMAFDYGAMLAANGIGMSEFLRDFLTMSLDDEIETIRGYLIERRRCCLQMGRVFNTNLED